MAVKKGLSDDITYPLGNLDVLPLKSATDIHPHTSFTDGKIDLIESIEEAYENKLYEKGAIEHGNPVDEDIDHYTSFMKPFSIEEECYTSESIYPKKFETIKAILQDIEGGETLTDADEEKLREDVATLEKMNVNGRNLLQKSIGLNYSLIVPHGVELDYNPAIELAENEGAAVDSYEDAIVDFLKDAESLDSGYNYVLLSSHYVNTPFEPRYVKKDELFEEMSDEELGDVLETYRDKELLKIDSLSSKLDDLAVPEISGELMSQEEREDLREFIYSPENIYQDEKEESESHSIPLQPLEIENPGILAVGAHPTLIERNEEFMDYFRREQGLTTKEEIRKDLDERMDADISKQDVDDFLGEKAKESLYPETELRNFYQPMVKKAREEDNFIFEINGKGVERQHESVFWNMIDENLFGSDSHRPGEQPSRTEKFIDENYSNNTTLLTEKWLSKRRRLNEKN